MVEFMERYADLPMDLADASLVVQIDQEMVSGAIKG
jgi:hypothetical protein